MEVSLKYREIAYKIWRSHGQHLKKTVKALNRDHDYDITRQTLSKWRDEYGWEDRAARAEAAEKERSDATSDAAILDGFITRKQTYEDYFATLKPGQKPDDRAIQAYKSILTTMREIRMDIDEKRKEGIKTDNVGIDISRPIKTSEEAVLALQDAIEYKLNVMLAQPESFDPKIAKDIKAALDLVEKMKVQHVSEEKNSQKQKGFNAEQAEKIRQLLEG